MAATPTHSLVATLLTARAHCYHPEFEEDRWKIGVTTAAYCETDSRLKPGMSTVSLSEALLISNCVCFLKI
jgi:hypothetical protein